VARVVVLVILVEVELEELVELILVELTDVELLVELIEVELIEVELMLVEVLDVEVVVMIVDVLVLLVDVLDVLELVELVEVELVDVEVVCKYVESAGVAFISCPRESLYKFSLFTTAEAYFKLPGLTRLRSGLIALLSFLNCPVVSLYPQTPDVCSQIVQEPIFCIVSCDTHPTLVLRTVKLVPSHLIVEFFV
jgi:hypothetical protein